MKLQTKLRTWNGSELETISTQRFWASGLYLWYVEIMKSHQFSFYRVLSQRGRCHFQQNQNKQRQNITQDARWWSWWMNVRNLYNNDNRQSLAVLGRHYLFICVGISQGEWKCNSGNYYQFTPRGNRHLGCCNPHQMQELQDAPSPFSSHPPLALLSD